MKILKTIGAVLGALLLGLGLLWLLRSDPIGPISGRAVSGEEAPYPSDWSFTNEHVTISVETRPDDPHSVTTICFVADDTLYVPALNGSQKRWTEYVTTDPRVRLKIGERVYPAEARRVELDAETQVELLKDAAAKYPQLTESDDPLEDVWLFAIGPR